MKEVYIIAFQNLQSEHENVTNDAVFDNYNEAIKYCNIQNDYWNKVHEENKEYPWFRYYIRNIVPLRTKALINEEPVE